MNKIFAHHVISSLRPTAAFGLDGTEVIWESVVNDVGVSPTEFKPTNVDWQSTDVDFPSKAEYDAELARLQAQLIATEYQRARQKEYPAIGDQLDALWKGGVAAEEMLARVQAVKNKYPKNV